MLLRIAIGLILFSNFLSCSKEGIEKPYGFLHLRVDGYEEDIMWETITGTWVDSSGIAQLEATSYYFDRCRIHLKNITGIGSINPLNLSQFYYTDGVDFRPYAVTGTITITEASNKAIRGTFNLYFDNNYNGASGRRVKGDFGVVNRP